MPAVSRLDGEKEEGGAQNKTYLNDRQGVDFSIGVRTLTAARTIDESSQPQLCVNLIRT